jgi:PAS domain S-box-containing protein
MGNAGGERIATVCLVNDITERKSAEAALRASEERLSKAQRIAHVGNWERDLVTGGLWWSAEIYRIYGVDPGQFLPTRETVEEAVHPEDRARFVETVRAATGSRTRFEMDYRIVRPDGKVRTVHAIGEVNCDQEGRPVLSVGTVQDVTEQRQAEAERELLIAQLREANEKLQSLDKIKSNFITMVSHELRTPLTTIKAFVELILVKQHMSEEQRRKLMSTVNVEADRLGRLIADLLDLSRIESGTLKMQSEQVSLDKLVRDVLTGMTLLFEQKGLQLSVDLEPGLPLVTGDRDRLVQVVTNILSNAVKFTLPGGTIRVAVRQEASPAPRIAVEISDTGIGIAAPDLERIFEKFHRSDDKRTATIEGTGLGLAITREIVEHHGGSIWATSEYGQGSTFTFTLPVGGQDGEKADSSARSRSLSGLSN